MSYRSSAVKSLHSGSKGVLEALESYMLGSRAVLGSVVVQHSILIFILLFVQHYPPSQSPRCHYPMSLSVSVPRMFRAGRTNGIIYLQG
jgi:hypothetical protein